MCFRKNMLDNNQKFRVVDGEMPQESSFDRSLRSVENFGQLYKFVDSLTDGLVGKDEVKHSSQALQTLVKETIEKARRTGVLNVSRLSEVSDGLAKKVFDLINRWYKDNAELGLDA